MHGKVCLSSRILCYLYIAFLMTFTTELRQPKCRTNRGLPQHDCSKWNVVILFLYSGCVGVSLVLTSGVCSVLGRGLDLLAGTIDFLFKFVTSNY